MKRRDEVPPRRARALLDWLLPPSDAGAATGDLDEEYTRFILPSRSLFAADCWYWRQVLLSAPRLLSRRRSGDGSILGSLARDLRFAARVLRRRPGHTIAAVATLALGLGVSTTLFTVVNAVLIRPLPFAETDRLVRPLPDALFFMNSAEAQLFAERTSVLESFAAWGRTLFLFTAGGEAEEVRGARVTWNHFDMLGVDPLIGRTFERADAESDDVVVLSHGLWMRRFGGDRGVIGSAIQLSGRSTTVIGVLRPEHVPMEFDWQAWRTLPLDPELSVGMALAGNARLRDGADIDQAREELKRVLPEIWAEGGYYASEEERAALDVVALRTWLIGDAQQGLFVLAGAVGLILLLACANVTNLLLAQNGSRAREFAVRAALGGSRVQLARQLFIEVLLLSALGGALALLASLLSLDWLAGRLPADLPRGGNVSISGAVVLFAAVSTIGVALLTGLVPALRSSGQGMGRWTRGGRSGSTGRERARLRWALVASEMALAVVLVVGAGLMLRTLASLRAVDPGFDADGVVTVRPSPPADRYPRGPELDAYYARLTLELERLPGVRSVGAIQFLPMTPGGSWTTYRPEGLVIGAEETPPTTAMRVVRKGYFETMRIPLVGGRMLTAADGEPDRQAVAVVNETFAREAFPDGPALGRNVVVDSAGVRIVGVVKDVRQSDLRTRSHAEMYMPFGRSTWRRMHMVVRTDEDEIPMLNTVAQVVRAIDGDVSMIGPRMMSDIVGTTFGDARLLTALLTLFGFVGLGLGAIGVYGVTAQSVSERRRDIGIRIALGADATGVVRMTVLRGLGPVALGLCVGLLGAFVGRGVLDGLLYGVASSDPRTFVTAPSVLFLVALLSLVVPAVRASRVDPAMTLREE